MTPLSVQFEPGRPIVDQVVFAAIRAFVSGRIAPGEAFPSVRKLALDLRIHPNTAHKVVQTLIRDEWLDVHPGIGTIVAHRSPRHAEMRQRLVDGKIDALVVEARGAGLSLDDLHEAIAHRWCALDTTEPQS